MACEDPLFPTAVLMGNAAWDYFGPQKFGDIPKEIVDAWSRGEDVPIARAKIVDLLKREFENAGLQLYQVSQEGYDSGSRPYTTNLVFTF